MTGVSALAVGTPAKRLQLVHELMLTAGEIAFLRNPNNPNFSALETRELQGAAAAAATSFQVRSHYAVPNHARRSLGGARIETCPALQFLPRANVAPLAGARIETPRRQFQRRSQGRCAPDRSNIARLTELLTGKNFG
jgi:hypothetical protein